MMRAGLGLRSADVAALSACVQLADVATDFIQRNPDCEIARQMREAAGELGEDGNKNIAMLPAIIANGQALVAAMRMVVDVAHASGANPRRPHS